MSRPIDVVVVAFGANDGLLDECLASVIDDRDVGRVYVVDNSGSATIPARGEQRVSFIRPGRNLGFGAAQNLGRSHSQAPFILMLNPDACMVAGALRAGVASLETDSAVAAVQGVCRHPNGIPDRSQGRELGPLHLIGRATSAKRILATRLGRRVARSLKWSADHADRIPDRSASVEWLSATALLARRSVLDDLGGFDEGFFLYGEDLDLSRRLRLAGHRLLALPVEWASHHSGAAFSSRCHREVEWWRGTLRYAAKWWPRSHWGFAVFSALLRGVTWSPGRTAPIREAWHVVREAQRARHAGVEAVIRPSSAR